MPGDKQAGSVIRLVVPQWQGGGNPHYGLGARLAAWLAPSGTAPVVEIDVPGPPPTPVQPVCEDGMAFRTQLKHQYAEIRKVLAERQPKAVVTFGGDCFVSLAPFAYLKDLYGDAFGVLWIDAHPDTAGPNDSRNAHTMVMGSLLGHGDREFANLVAPALNNRRVFFAGLRETKEFYNRFVNEHGLRRASSAELDKDFGPVTSWLSENGITKLAIHFDVDVISPAEFRAQSFTRPGTPLQEPYMGGDMPLLRVAPLINAAASVSEIVGLTIAEHVPWDAANLQSIFQQIPLLHKEEGLREA